MPFYFRENEAKHSFKKDKFFIKGGAIAPNAPCQLRHCSLNINVSIGILFLGRYQATQKKSWATYNKTDTLF